MESEALSYAHVRGIQEDEAMFDDDTDVKGVVDLTAAVDVELINRLRVIGMYLVPGIRVHNEEVHRSSSCSGSLDVSRKIEASSYGCSKETSQKSWKWTS